MTLLTDDMNERLQGQIECLRALRTTGSLDAAARHCGLDRDSLLQRLTDAEAMYGRPLVKLRDACDSLTPMGEVVLRCAGALGMIGPLGAETAPGVGNAGSDAGFADGPWAGLLDGLLRRRSVSPKRLAGPGPSPHQLELMIQAALSAPDHGALRPWRILEFRDEQRAPLAALFEDEKRRRDPLASATDLRRAREHATRPPVLLAFVVSPRQRAGIPRREQWLAAGAALGNLLNAAHQLGFGAIVLSGERCHDNTLTQALGLTADEALAGFLSLGRITQAPPARRPTLPGRVWSCWMPRTTAAEDLPRA